MTLSLKEVEQIISSGQALPAINEFLRFASLMNVAVRAGEVENTPGMDATYIAAIVLQRLIDTKDGRRLLGIRKSNKVYNVKDFRLDSPQLDIARRLGMGAITQPAALEELRAALAKADIYPDPKTLKQILRDLEDEACNVRIGLEELLRVAGWDGDLGNLQEVYTAMTTGKGIASR
jgi:hypothetical protein